MKGVINLFDPQQLKINRCLLTVPCQCVKQQNGILGTIFKENLQRTENRNNPCAATFINLPCALVSQLSH